MASDDHIDVALIELLSAEPGAGAPEASRRLGVARNTVQTHLERMQERGVITGTGPTWIRPRSATRSPRSSR